MFFLQVWGGNITKAQTVDLELEGKGNLWKLGQIGVLFSYICRKFQKVKPFWIDSKKNEREIEKWQKRNNWKSQRGEEIYNEVSQVKREGNKG